MQPKEGPLGIQSIACWATVTLNGFNNNGNGRDDDVYSGWVFKRDHNQQKHERMKWRQNVLSSCLSYVDKN